MIVDGSKIIINNRDEINIIKIIHKSKRINVKRLRKHERASGVRISMRSSVHKR